MTLEELKHVIIVHGEKPQKGCNPHPEFLRRLEKAVDIANHEEIDGIIVTGGATRKNCKTEAVFGAKYLQDRVSTKVFIEGCSHTTVENIRFTKKFLSDSYLKQVIVISSTKRMLRLKYLYKRIWPEIYGNIMFVGAHDSYGFYFYFLELVYFMYSILDITEYVFPRLTKRWFRNL